jgi:hypothetical protein
VSEVARFDIGFMLRQCALIAGLAFIPLVAIAALSRRRRWLLPLSLACGGAAWIVLFLTVFQRIDSIRRDSLPYQPFRVGPSIFALWDILLLLGFTVWLPTLVIYLLARHLVGRRRHSFSPVVVVACFLIYSLVGTAWTWFWLRMAEWSHEDTFTAPGFSWAAWKLVRPGMTRTEVEAHLGPPISPEFRPAFAQQQGAECWVSNLSAGYFAAVWFESDKVVRKQFWYSD